MQTGTVTCLPTLSVSVEHCRNDSANDKAVGLYVFRFKPKEYPAVPGLEGVGTVAKNGPGASKFKVVTPATPASA